MFCEHRTTDVSQRRQATDRESQVPEHPETCLEKVQQSDVTSQENPGQASGDRLQIQGVQVLGDQSQNVLEWLEFCEEGFSGELPDSHNVAAEQSAVEPKGKTLADLIVSSEEE